MCSHADSSSATSEVWDIHRERRETSLGEWALFTLADLVFGFGVFVGWRCRRRSIRVCVRFYEWNFFKWERSCAENIVWLMVFLVSLWNFFVVSRTSEKLKCSAVCLLKLRLFRSFRTLVLYLPALEHKHFFKRVTKQCVLISGHAARRVSRWFSSRDSSRYFGWGPGRPSVPAPRTHLQPPSNQEEDLFHRVTDPEQGSFTQTAVSCSRAVAEQVTHHFLSYMMKS